MLRSPLARTRSADVTDVSAEHQASERIIVIADPIPEAGLQCLPNQPASSTGA
jgi:hypothetical protein